MPEPCSNGFDEEVIVPIMPSYKGLGEEVIDPISPCSIGCVDVVNALSTVRKILPHVKPLNSRVAKLIAIHEPSSSPEN